MAVTLAQLRKSLDASKILNLRAEKALNWLQNYVYNAKDFPPRERATAKNVFEKGRTLVAAYLRLKEFSMRLCENSGGVIFALQSCATKIEDIKFRIMECVDILLAYEQKKTKRMILVVNENGIVTLAKNGTEISSADYAKIRWQNYKTATRDLLRATFSREVLSTHTLSGKPSPAFLNENKELKSQLEPSIVEDIIAVVTSYFGLLESSIRVVITNTCADENKMMRRKKANKQKPNAGPMRVSTGKSEDSEQQNVDEVDNAEESESTPKRPTRIPRGTASSSEISVASTSRSVNCSTVTISAKIDNSVTVSSTSSADTSSSKISSSFETCKSKVSNIKIDNDLAIAGTSGIESCSNTGCTESTPKSIQDNSSKAISRSKTATRPRITKTRNFRRISTKTPKYMNFLKDIKSSGRKTHTRVNPKSTENNGSNVEKVQTTSSVETGPIDPSECDLRLRIPDAQEDFCRRLGLIRKDTLQSTLSRDGPNLRSSRGYNSI